MPLHLPPVPPAASHSVLAALRSPAAARHRGSRRPVAPETAPCSLRPELPLPLHETGLSDRPSGGPCGAPLTRLAGWRFLLRETESPAGSAFVGAAEAVLTAEGWSFAYFCEGPYVASTQHALEQAESLPGAFQPRLLSIPRLYMLTLWLHRRTSAAADEGSPEPSDLLIPLAPAPPGIAAHRPSTVETLFPLLESRMVTGRLLRTSA